VPLAGGHSTAFFGAVGATALKVLRQEKGRDLRVAREEVLMLEAKEEAFLEDGTSADVLGQDLAVSMEVPGEVVSSAEVTMEEAVMGGPVSEEMETKVDETAADEVASRNSEGVASSTEAQGDAEAKVPEVPGTEQQRRSTGSRQSMSEKSSVLADEERQQQQLLPQSLTTGRVSSSRVSEEAVVSEPCSNVSGADADFVHEDPLACECSHVKAVLGEVLGEETKGKTEEAGVMKASADTKGEDVTGEEQSENSEGAREQESSEAEDTETGEVQAAAEVEGEQGKGGEAAEEEGSKQEGGACEEGQGQQAMGCEGEKAGALAAAAAAAGMEIPVLIAEGGFGKVYRHGNTAVKMMKEFNRQEVEIEYYFMQTMGAKSDNVLKAWDLQFGSNICYFRMPLCQGSATDLAKAHQEATGRVGLPEKWVLQILKQTAQALSVCHANEVCHFDIKPANLLLTHFPSCEEEDIGEGTVKLSDFGVAMLVPDVASWGGPGAQSITWPRRWRPWGRGEGEGPKTAVGPACDMYSLGQTVCILLLGPDSDDASGVSATTRSLVHALMEDDPSKRMTAAQLLKSRRLLNHPLLKKASS